MYWTRHINYPQTHDDIHLSLLQPQVTSVLLVAQSPDIQLNLSLAKWNYNMLGKLEKLLGQLIQILIAIVIQL